MRPRGGCSARTDTDITGPDLRAAGPTLGARVMRAFDRLVDLGGLLAAILLIAVMLLTTIKVVFRYVLNIGLIGVDQISGTLLLYIALFGAAWVLRRNEHVTIDLLLGHVGARTRWVLTLTSASIGAAVCLVVTVFGVMEVVASIQGGVNIPAEIEMPRAVNLIIIPVGFLFLTIEFVRQALDVAKAGEVPPPRSAQV